MRKKKVSLDGRIEDYIPEWESYPVGKIKISDLLLHQAGLKPWKAFYFKTIENLWPDLRLKRWGRKGGYVIPMGSGIYMHKNVVPSPYYYAQKPSETYTVPVGKSMWGRKGIGDSVILDIAQTPLGEAGKYAYSDWGFILLQQVAERVGGGSLDALAKELVYRPLGMRQTMYTPWKYGKARRCSPTEHDLYFRKGIVQGYAHDMAAAMLGGVAGHAGLFSTAWDVATYGEMLRRMGSYGTHQLYDSSTVSTFTHRPLKAKENYRAYGFDKPNPKRKASSYIGDSISGSSYGHIGFTGTILWVDPEEDFVFALLSNRTFPDSNNLRINSLRIRSQIMNALYESIRRRTN